MTVFYCDSCKKEIETDPLILKVESLHRKAPARNDLMLCEKCEKEIHFAIYNAILNGEKK